ncbi:hypothetical protein [Actinoplanes subtropicus]|jgi:hypothetical protein|uniref:hypothetical protein n=1 Tax=Actinoplanes subtropicus TaxID=543632 RepID=UPI0004C36025|nr:hypothetical protein [Actinoplanes subtropicus]
MTTTTITRQDLDSLAEKLATVQLSEQEQTVLLALFAIAADALGRTLPDTRVVRSVPGVTVAHGAELPDLSTIFDQAFAPALTADGGGGGSDDTVKVQLGKIGR